MFADRIFKYNIYKPSTGKYGINSSIIKVLFVSNAYQPGKVNIFGLY